MTMEWVERTDRTVDAAKDFLLDQLGVDETEAEFEILEEPKPGLFGRVRGQARVRARVAPRAPRNDDRRRRPARKSGSDKERNAQGSSGGQAKRTGSKPAKATPTQQEHVPVSEDAAPTEGPKASKSTRPRQDAAPVDPEPFIPPLREFLDQLVTAFGLTGSTTVEIVDGELEARIDGAGLGAMIGPAGAVINAIQELARTFLQKVAHGGSAPRLRVDVGGYRAARRTALAAFAKEIAESVVSTGRPHALEPMGSVDRKIVHDAASEVAGVVTRSDGDDPDRHVVIVPA